MLTRLRLLLPVVLLHPDFTSNSPSIATIAMSTEYSSVRSQFEDDLIGRLHSGDNECSSALGVKLALSLVYPSMVEGSDAKRETENLLGFRPGKNMFADFRMAENDHSNKRGPTVKIAYALWFDSSKKLHEAYSNSPVLQHLHGIDFRASKAGEEINAWVRDSTENRIESIVSPGRIRGDFVAVNAIYLKAAWRNKFQASHTTLENFSSPTAASPENSRTKRVPFMHQVQSYDYGEVDDYQVLRLPFSGSEKLSMILALPNVAGSPAKQRFTAAQLVQSWSNLKQRAVAVALPKFTFTSSYSSQLESALREMGWKAAFRGGLRIFDTSESSLDMILQKTFISVSEDGVEAAGVTAIMTRSLQRRPVETPVLFQADRPFQFFITDGSNVLFEGHVSDPEFPLAEELEFSSDSHNKEGYWTESFRVETPTGPADGYCANES